MNKGAVEGRRIQRKRKKEENVIDFVKCVTFCGCKCEYK